MSGSAAGTQGPKPKANHRLKPIQVYHPRQRWTGAYSLSGDTTFLARTLVLIQGGGEVEGGTGKGVRS